MISGIGGGLPKAVGQLNGLVTENYADEIEEVKSWIIYRRVGNKHCHNSVGKMGMKLASWLFKRRLAGSTAGFDQRSQHDRQKDWKKRPFADRLLNGKERHGALKFDGCIV